MKALLVSILEKIAGRIKGASYRLDSRLSFSVLLGCGMRRAMGLVRCIARGVAFSPDRLIFIGKGVELRNRSYITFGKGVSLGKFSTIDGLSQEGIKLGDAVSIGPYCVIEASGSLKNLGKGISVGANTGIGGFSFIGGAGGVVIGRDVIMGQWVSFHPENHVFEDIDQPIRLQGVTRQGIIVEDDCWVGAKVTFLDGAHVGKGCVIAAGAVVRGYIPDYSIAAGVPARVIKTRKRTEAS